MNKKIDINSIYNINKLYSDLPDEEKKVLNKNDFIKLLTALNNLSTESLLKLCDHPDIQLHFCGEDWRTTTPKKEIIYALLADFSKSKLFSIINKNL